MSFFSFITGRHAAEPAINREIQRQEFARSLDERLAARAVGRSDRQRDARIRESVKLRLQIEHDPLLRGRR